MFHTNDPMFATHPSAVIGRVPTTFRTTPASSMMWPGGAARLPLHHTSGAMLGGLVLSMLAMITYSARMHRWPVPVHEIATSWVDRLDAMLTALLRDRDLIGPKRSIDVRFDDFMADERGIVAQVYDLAGEALVPEAQETIDQYLAGHQRGRLGRVEATAEMFGLDEDEFRTRFAPYSDRFLT